MIYVLTAHILMTEEKYMGFTIEDMLTVSKTRYGMNLLAGANGWSNSISWILLIEDLKILNNFKGKDLAITTGFGFQDEESQLKLVSNLIRLDASGTRVFRSVHVNADEEVAFCLASHACAVRQGGVDIRLSRIDHFDILAILLHKLSKSQSDSQIDVLLLRAIAHSTRVFTAVPSIDDKRVGHGHEAGKREQKRGQ